MQVAKEGLRRLVLFVRMEDLSTPPNHLLRQFKKSGGPDGVHIPNIFACSVRPFRLSKGD